MWSDRKPVNRIINFELMYVGSKSMEINPLYCLSLANEISIAGFVPSIPREDETVQRRRLFAYLLVCLLVHLFRDLMIYLFISFFNSFFFIFLQSLERVSLRQSVHRSIQPSGWHRGTLRSCLLICTASYFDLESLQLT